jgi:cell shape-determining protein MreC
MIPVYLTNSNWPAVVQGQSGKLLKIKFLSSKAKPIDGEIVQTSGHGGRLPPGINVGKVVKSYSGKYYVKPTVDFHRLTYISIIINKNSLPVFTRNFQGYAPLQRPEPSITLKGLNLGGKRINESSEN